MAKINFNQEKVLLQNEYTKFEESTIKLNEMGANQELELHVKRMDYKAVRVPKINEFGAAIENEYCNKLSTTIYMYDDNIINSLSTSISRFVFMLLKSMDIEIEKMGYVKMVDLDLNIKIKKINKNSKNSYKCSLISINNNEADMVSLDTKDIKTLLYFNNVLEDYDDERLAIEGEGLPISE